MDNRKRALADRDGHAPETWKVIILKVKWEITTVGMLVFPPSETTDKLEDVGKGKLRDIRGCDEKDDGV